MHILYILQLKDSVRQLVPWLLVAYLKRAKRNRTRITPAISQKNIRHANCITSKATPVANDSVSSIISSRLVIELKLV